MEKDLTLQEAEKATKIPRATLRRWAEAGKIAGYQINKGNRLVWMLSQSSLKAIENIVNLKSYNDLLEQWNEEQANGTHSGKPLGKSHRYNNKIGLRNYWTLLGIEPDLNELSPDNLTKCFAAIKVDYKEKNCHYAMKHQIFKAIYSFHKFLIRHGLKTQAHLDAFKDKKPKRLFPPRKTILQEDKLQKLLDENELWFSGRDDYDRMLTKMLVMIFAFAGLRRNEALALEIGHIDFENGILTVIDGKGHKNRVVGLIPELAEQLQVWIQEWRPTSKSSILLLQKSGRPITEEIINHRILSLARHAKIDITPHGLRRTFATLMENRGMPWSYMQRALGHSDIKTTQGYVMSDDKKMVEWLKTHGSFNKQQQQSEEPVKQEEFKPKTTPQLSAKDITLLKLLEEDDI